MNPDRMRRGNVFHRRNGSPKVLVLSISQTMNIASTREKGSKYQSTDGAGEITTGELFLEDFYEGVTDVMGSLYKIRTSMILTTIPFLGLARSSSTTGDVLCVTADKRYH